MSVNTRFFSNSRKLLSGAAMLICVVFSSVVFAFDWSGFRRPSNDTPEPVGRYSNGCIKGAQPLKDRGIGYQIIRLSRNRYYGHPDLINYLTLLGLRVDAEGLGTMLVGDMAMPRGGRFSSGHRSHQTGLDADVWLRMDLPEIPAFAREGLRGVSMVDMNRLKVIPKRWTEKQTRLIQLAADDGRVSRIFVNPAIKAQLCENFGNQPENTGWLRKVRPWYGHNEHMHVRLNCPDNAPLCKNQSPPPQGNSCGVELASWFPDPNRKPAAKKPTKPRPHRIIVMPKECYAMLVDEGRVAKADKLKPEKPKN